MLNDMMIRGLKPSEKPQKFFDEKGLFLLLTPSGSRLWRFKYRFPINGPLRKEKLLALGAYPEVSLKEAREDRDEARRDLRHGIDPGIKRKAEERSGADTFKAVALELFAILRKSSVAGHNPPEAAAEVVERTIQPGRKRKARRREPISADTIDTMQRRLEAHVFPHIGETDVGQLTGPDLLAVLRRIESRGTFELTHRVRSICSRVLRYARATGRKCEDVAADLIGLLVPVEPEHMAAIVEPIKIGQLLRAIDGYTGQPLTRLALKLVPYIFPRPIEFRTMEWTNITLDGSSPEWRVPWRRMKMRKPHIVPLSRQAVVLLHEIRVHSGRGRWVFPQLRHPDRPMSENCITAALRALGYSGAEMSWHGFRALANTQLMEIGWHEKWVDMQLAHQEHNKVRKAYNHAKYLPQRVAMMQAWADYVDALRWNTEITVINQACHRRTRAVRNISNTEAQMSPSQGGGSSRRGFLYAAVGVVAAAPLAAWSGLATAGAGPVSILGAKDASCRQFASPRHRTAYIEVSPATGPLMIFLHGWPHLGLSWRPQLAHFAAAGWRCIAPDLRGYGGSSAPRAGFRRDSDLLTA